MKRSDINREIDWAIGACKKLGFHLPSFAFWGPKDWADRKDKTEHMVSVAQGWDVTDYNSGNFDHTGAVLFTVHTYRTPLGGLASDPAWARRFLEVLDGLPPALLAYKGVASVAEPLHEYLSTTAIA